MLKAVRYQLADQPDDEHLQAAERMLLAALARISDAIDKRDKKGIWA